MSGVSVIRLGLADAGEVFTLQRAAYVSEAQLYGDPELPPLVQALDDLTSELADPDVIALGIRAGGRLVAAVRLLVRGATAELGRLIVAPDLQGRGLGTRLMEDVDAALPASVRRVELFTGERSTANLRLYRRLGYTEFRRRPAGTYDLVFLERAVRDR
ncbi:MAG: GNAT family N-acetyltransferase [Propionicimonas sp.]|uniref:GNAT family N-acetyltransferase n=1 Tax=Propionicimonas sp. TaxID=1955623 RepID=UPI003D0FB403